MTERLLNIGPASPRLPHRTLDSPGGFAWWYADVVDEEGNGLVLIWSYGLPFLPGYTSAARAGRPQVPRRRPSLNISVYEGGKLACYLLQELDEADATWDRDASTWRFGDSTFRFETGDGSSRLRVTLDCPIPSSHERLRGSVTLQGPERVSTEGATWQGHHDWSPLIAVADAHCDIEAGLARYVIDGRGYHDCNAGASTLADAGIAAWAWGRVPHETEERVYYLLWDTNGEVCARGIKIGNDGVLDEQPLVVEQIARRWGRAGLRHPSRLRLLHEGAEFLDIRAEPPMDDGPFYVRHLIHGHDRTGIGEFCRPDCIDLAIHRPLVRMRVHRVGGENSVWLPLFTGPRPGRLARLFTRWTR